MRCLVTGGGGFLGSRICRMLCAQGHEVTALGRNRYPSLETAGIETLQADLEDAEAIQLACQSKDAVFHVGAMAGIWGRKAHFWRTNVIGTENVLAGCRKHSVPFLVYTSSPSVVFGREPLCGVNESHPYPTHYTASYPETKAVAESKVLQANGPTFMTVSLRPHLIWGPGDPHLIPRVIERARRGRLRQVGDGNNLVDITYIDNAVHAHVLALAALSSGKECSGKAYFISQGEPVRLWPWLNDVLALAGVQPIRRQISHSTAYRAGAAFECLYTALRLRSEPPMTRFLADQLAHSHYFDLSAARRDLGYEPIVSIQDGLRRLKKSWST